MISEKASEIFKKTINDYHLLDSIDQPFRNPYKLNSIDNLLYRKSWIDTIQWHYEDLIRDPKINEEEALELKRKIDVSNQERTDTVEFIDSYFLKFFESVKPKQNATINTESPAWALDRLSILELKIYHMREESLRENANKIHRETCSSKLSILIEQKKDLSQAIDQLLKDIKNGNKFMKVYKQMKMYNDEDLNPILYGLKG
tara:strand:+ start:2945 stop:3550 length:606 start_codon:yes stop_codon:yes gene_type:complete